MKTYLLILLLFSTCISLAQEAFPFYHLRNSFQMTSPGAMKYGLYGFDNPALLSYVDKFNLQFNWSDRYGNWDDFTEWGIFSAVPNFGFGVIHSKIGEYFINDYNLSTAFGNRVFSFGVSYGWSSGDENVFNRTSVIALGLLYRPVKYLSAGIVGSFSTSVSTKEGYIDFAVRPFGNEKLSIFADYTIRNNSVFGVKKEHWSTGAAFEIIPGFRITGRYFDSKRFTTGIQLSLGNLGIGSQAHFNENGKHAYTSNSIRLGGYDRNLLRQIFPPRNFLELDLNGSIKYRRFIIFDKSNTLISLLNKIKAAKEDNGIYGIAINTSGLEANREMLWELRAALQDFKSAGKQVVVFVDQPSMDLYHFASVADKIALDPLGVIQLPGYVSGRTFYKGTAEKLGFGIDELRFFKYKSAYENFSNEQMTEGDREQRKELLNDIYNLVKKDICNDRKISEMDFENLINNYVLVTANDAIERKLADTLCRWEGLKEIVSKENFGITGSGSIEKFKLPKDHFWGEPDRIAVIYALGATAMDDGISARRLVEDFNKAGNDPLVKAIVLRVDSPGGDAVAADYIDEAIKKFKGKKPIIVSQGSVAGSGGYWLSMNADTIIAAPNTITGSIGVIGVWIYSKGLKEKLGMTTDKIQIGEHADLLFGPTFPFIGVGIPDRPLTKEERKKAENLIRGMYSEFVTKVSEGRNLSKEYVNEIGQGRIYSGIDGVENKLVDLLGGLNDAINIAMEKANIKPDEEIKFVEYPDMPLFDLGILKPKFYGMDIEESVIIKQLKFRLKNNGMPLPIIPLEDMELIK